MAHGFIRLGDQLETRLEPLERAMLRQLLDEMCELLAGDSIGDPDDLDPLARELGLDSLTGDDIEAPQDPILSRLLPDAYRHDPVAAHEFRKYTDSALRRGKIADAKVVRAGLDSADSDPDGAVLIPEDLAPAWLRAINDLRLALGVKLDITDSRSADLSDIDDDDPRAPLAALYDFLTWWQDSLVRALMGDLDF